MRSLIISLLAATTANALPQSTADGGLLELMMIPVKNGPAPTGCSKYEIIIGRGTGEPGLFGAVVGDILEKTVTKQLPGSRAYSVQYPASFDLTKSTPAGIDDVINRLNKQNKECPDQTFALVGYSQGAGIMHGALGPPQPAGPNAHPTLDLSVLPKIKSLVMFGDPGFKGVSAGLLSGNAGQFPPELFAKLMQNCALKDGVCDPSGGGFENHLQYGSEKYQKPSAEFIIAGFKGDPLPKAVRTPKERDEAAKAS